jgi:hypothetical protein
VFLEGWVGVLCSCRFRFSWVCLVGFFLSFFGLFFFRFPALRFLLYTASVLRPDAFNKVSLLLIKTITHKGTFNRLSRELRS